MADAKELPKTTMLYKHRENGVKNEHAWNLPLDTKIVEDDDVEAHHKDGWLTAAQVHAPKKAKPEPHKPAA